MKRIICLLLLIAHMNILTDPITGTITEDNNGADGITFRSTGRFYNETESYVNGGLTITYPPNFWSFLVFDSIPRVMVSIQLNGAPSPTDTYVAVLSSSSPSAATVMVYKVSNGGTVAEAATGEVSVTLLAIQNFSDVI